MTEPRQFRNVLVKRPERLKGWYVATKPNMAAIQAPEAAKQKPIAMDGIFQI